MKQKFISLSVLALTALSLTACGTSNNEATVETAASSNTTASSNATKPTEEKKAFSIGDKVTFDDEAAITITAANYTDERNQFADSNPLHVLAVTYNVDNLSDKDYVIGSEVTLYVNGKKMETYPISTTFETISAGRSFEGATQGFAITEEGDYELEVKPSLSFTSKPVVIKFTVQ